jgi:hypothetical protein
MASLVYDLTPVIDVLNEYVGNDAVTIKVNTAVSEVVRKLGKHALDRLNQEKGGWSRDVKFNLLYHEDPVAHTFSFEITSDDNVFKWVDEGTGFDGDFQTGYMIEPKPSNPGELAFLWGDVMMYRSKVHHPGIDPREYTQEVVNEMEAVVNEWVGRAVVKAFQSEQD